MPGGFDYGRKLWFDGIGATGRVTSAVTVDGQRRGPARVAGRLAGRLRAAMGARIHAALAEPYASFAEALITGERSTIPPEINRSLQVSGLFHILSISGLHMWLVAGGVFWAVRAVLALVPRAGAGAGRSRNGPPAAALLIGAVLHAAGRFRRGDGALLHHGGRSCSSPCMVDRPALSTRNLAIAAAGHPACASPEAAVEASFQMSFLAVLGLVAFHEAWSRYAAARGGGRAAQRHWAMRLAAWGFTALPPASSPR